ncbi:hypothetical protein [Streptomyces sp. NPDC017964]|uniref:hypothetical protein n=1 Tax=Streptomyces sp. NPDC017964 TaxID=3365022 RepID=UPI0037AD00D3
MLRALWRVVHPEAGVVGVLLQGYGTRVHVEWFDAANKDYFSAAEVANLRHGAAAIVNARQHAGQGLPVDVEPESYKAPEPVRPVWLKDDTLVRYHGSLEQLAGGIFRVFECAVVDECDDWDCQGYALFPVGVWRPCAVHVGPAHVTALDAEPAVA